MSDVGYFVFSLDTELGWGDLWGQPHLQKKARDGPSERVAIQRLLDMMDEFGVVATWAITGHLFFSACEECASCPVMDLRGQDRRFEQIWKTDNSMWYGADLVDTLLACNAGHEVGFHGHTHRTFDRLTRDEARFEILEWIRLAARKGIAPQSVIFPQGRIKHLELFVECGFRCYRGSEVRHPVLNLPVIGKVVNKVNLKLALLTPQVFDPTIDALGLVNIPGSLWLFRTNRAIESLLDRYNLHTLRLQRAAKSIERAARRKQVVHLWLHPQELRTDKDFLKLRYLFERVAMYSERGELKSITMGELARKTLQAKEPPSGTPSMNSR